MAPGGDGATVGGVEGAVTKLGAWVGVGALMCGMSTAAEETGKRSGCGAAGTFMSIVSVAPPTVVLSEQESEPSVPIMQAA